MVIITRVSLDRCKFSSANKRELKAVHDLLRIFVEGAFHSKIYQEGKWDGYHKFYDRNDFFDFGITDELIYNLEMKEIPWKYKDSYRFKRHKIIPKGLDKQRPYQKEAIKEFFVNNIGIIIVPTRGGKTFIASELINQTLKFDSSFPCLFMVDTVDLFKQAVDDISSYLKIKPEEIGTINDRGLNPKIITVAMIQTLTARLYFQIRTSKMENKQKVFLTKEEIRLKKKEKNREKRQIEKYLASVKFLLVDEIHEQSSDKRMRVMQKCKNVVQRLGLSATPFKQIGGTIQNLTVKGFFGGVTYTVPKKRLQKEGYLAMDKIFLMSYDHSGYIKRNRLAYIDNYHDQRTNSIHFNDERNYILEKLIRICKRHSWKTLVIFNSKVHGKHIAELTGEKFIHGDSKSEERLEEKNKFLKGKGKILIASNIFKKGITLPQAQIMILGDGGLEGTGIEQKAGRVLGAVEGKTKAAIIDVMDVGVKYFDEHSLNRLETYSKGVTKDRMEVYEPDEFEIFTESLKEWLTEEE